MPAGAGDDRLAGRPLPARADWFGDVLAQPELYEGQVLYTQVDRRADNQPMFRSRAFRVDLSRHALDCRAQDAEPSGRRRRPYVGRYPLDYQAAQAGSGQPGARRP